MTKSPLWFLVVVMAAVGLVPAVAFGDEHLPVGGTFIDDNGSVFEPSIEAIAAVGIARGCNPPRNDRFCPNDPVTRGQMAAFVVRARELTDPGPGDRFVDDDGSTFEEDIQRLATAGITLGCNPPVNDRFCPDDPVTRGQIAAMLVRAYGYDDPGPGDRFVDDDGSTFEEDIQRLATAGITLGCNPPVNDRFCPNDPVTRGQMAAFLQRAEDLDPLPPPPPTDPALVAVATGLASPVFVTAPEGDDRVFIVEQGGTIRILTDNGVRSQPFLDISGDVVHGGERGLLSMAFHPDYAANGRFFVYYSSPTQPANCPGANPGCHTSVIAEYEVSSDPNVANPTRSEILTVPQPYGNHNGGQLEFGPDGRLYIALGDGGSGNDPHGNGQNTGSLLGSILRIDVDGPGNYTSPPANPFVGKTGRNEIWVYGLRNPWRFAFDDDTLYIGDVGQNAREEVDAVSASTAAGTNFGWRIFEANQCTNLDPCTSAGFTFPVLEYSHTEGCSITGGGVYRGTEATSLTGHYLYGDYCSGWIRSFRLEDGKVTDAKDWTDELGTVPSLVSFGVDGHGEMYVVSLTGTVYRIEAK